LRQHKEQHMRTRKLQLKVSTCSNKRDGINLCK
jgi:hypothetical protein